MTWFAKSARWVIPPAPMVTVLPAVEMRLNAPAVLLNVNDLTFQGSVRSGVNWVLPAKMISAVPSFAGGEAGVQVALLFQLLLPDAPFHVHVAAQTGMAVRSAARMVKGISRERRRVFMA